MLAWALLGLIFVVLPAAAFQAVSLTGLRRAWHRIAAATFFGALPGALAAVATRGPTATALGLTVGAAFGFATGLLLYLLQVLRGR